MDAAPLPRTSLSDEVVARLRAEIVEGRWPVGERIPPESELVTTLGVARGTLREALRSLRYSGLIEIRRGDGTYVLSRSELPAALRRTGVELESVLEARSVLEPALARWAAERADPEAIDRIEEALARRREAGDDDWVDADAAMHEAVAWASGNRVLAEVYVALLPALREVTERALRRPGFRRDDPRGHEDVLAAIRAGDGEAAAARAAENLRATEAWHLEGRAEHGL
ncbi:FadR/GntR family transcriptional regulator [Nocardiopsis alba]|uniref:FadR/GntR family transcriptional regulator n=1 Tax=Nocardiopsis alba TaxID=53437 RepID=UPI0033BDF461